MESKDSSKDNDAMITALQTALVGAVTSVFSNMSKSDKKSKAGTSSKNLDTSDEDGSMEDFVNPRPLRKRYILICMQYIIITDIDEMRALK